MSDHQSTGSRCSQHEGHEKKAKWWKISFWIAGVGSTVWLLLRSGSKPKRLTYPCQRVAAANSLGFLGYLAAALGSGALLGRLRKRFSWGKLVALVALVVSAVVLQSSVASPVLPVVADSLSLPAWESVTAVSNVFAVTDVPEPQYSLDGGTIPGGVPASTALRDAGVDALVSLMEAKGDHFYKTSSHPDGLFASDDVIVIKVSSQWDERNNTNTDVVKGIIYRLVQHPESFSGAVIIAENPQSKNEGWYDLASNNSQFGNQSYQEVAQAFVGEGYRVCISDWRSFRTSFVDDYGDGDDTDGYVLDAVDDKLSYPKFGVDCGGVDLEISMRYGLWNGVTYDSTRLKMINMPVLKRHNSAWGTISVKNYLGFLNIYDVTGRWSGVSEKHCWLIGPSDNGYTCSGTGYSSDYGLIGRQMARIRRADLNLVDAIWVNPNNNLGAGSVRQDVLLASRDPFAVDYYASDYVLYPVIDQYSSTSTPEQAKASERDGWFRNIQMRNVARLRAEGVTDTINMSDSMSRAEELAQFNAFVVDAGAPTGPSVTLLAPGGGETWEIGTQEEIRWTSSYVTGDVVLAYSTDGFATESLIAPSTPDDGSFVWTVPEQASSTVTVRVSCVLTPSVADSSQSFSIVYPDVTPFEESSKSVSHSRVYPGDEITYTIVLYDDISATLTLTDTVPAPLSYVADSADIVPAWKMEPVVGAGSIQWSGVVTWGQPVTITFRALVLNTSVTQAIVNEVEISRDGAEPVGRKATSILNPELSFLPLAMRLY